MALFNQTRRVGKAGWWIRSNILFNAGLTEDQVWFDNVLRCFPPQNKGEHYPAGKDKIEAEKLCGQYDQWHRFPSTIPLLLVGGKALANTLALDGISNWHGHICIHNGRLVGCTFHPAAVMRNPNYLPLTIRETANLLAAARNPLILQRPEVIKGRYIYHGGPLVADLEWNPATGTTSVVGIADNSRYACSSFNVEEGLEIVRSHIESGQKIIGHNIITADLPKIGVLPKSWGPKHVIDTMVVAHLIHAHLAESGLLDLGSLVRFYFPTTDWKQDKEDLLTYNGLDCAYNFKLHDQLMLEVRATGQEHLIEKQQRLAHMSFQMHERGIRIDVPALTAYYVQRQAEKSEAKASFPINPNSPAQIVEWAKEKGIHISDAKFETLEKLQGLDPEFDRLIEYRTDTKSLKTWFPIETDKKGNLIAILEMIYPWFHVTGTDVARFSSSDPNCQNIPPFLRRFIIPRDPELELNAFDGSQIENRCVAWLAKCQPMLLKFASGEDFHRLNAAAIQTMLQGHLVQPCDVTKDQRQQGKTVTHATSYCETAYNLARRLFGNVRRESLDKAQALHDAFFRAYPEIARWHKCIGDQLDSGDVMLRNPFGRVRYIYAQDYHERQKRGCHFLGCSTAADIVNARALMVADELESEIGDLALPILIVHDELVYEFPRGEQGGRLRKRVKEILDSPIPEMDDFVIPFSRAQGSNYGKVGKDNPNGLVEL